MPWCILQGRAQAVRSPPAAVLLEQWGWSRAACCSASACPVQLGRAGVPTGMGPLALLGLSLPSLVLEMLVITGVHCENSCCWLNLQQTSLTACSAAGSTAITALKRNNDLGKEPMCDLELVHKVGLAGFFKQEGNKIILKTSCKCSGHSNLWLLVLS